MMTTVGALSSGKTSTGVCGRRRPTTANSTPAASSTSDALVRENWMSRESMVLVVFGVEGAIGMEVATFLTGATLR